MKKSFFLGIVVLTIIGCKKKWTCDCTYEYTFGSSTYSTTTSEESEKISKKDAQEWCDQQAYSTNGYSRSCELE